MAYETHGVTDFEPSKTTEQEPRTMSHAPARVSRRRFLSVSMLLLAGGALASCAGKGESPAPIEAAGKGKVAFRLSGRGRRISRAAKRHNAFHVFTTEAAADAHRAHAGDRSRVVPIVLSSEDYEVLFTRTGLDAIDLRTFT